MRAGGFLKLILERIQIFINYIIGVVCRVNSMEQIMSEQVVKGMRQNPVQAGDESPRPIVGNQTYVSPLTERVIHALQDLEPYMRESESSDVVPSAYEQCRKKLLNANLAAAVVDGQFVFGSRTGPVFSGARPLYLRALRRELASMRESFEDGSRYELVTPREISRVCAKVMDDIVIGPQAEVVFDSSLAYAEPNHASQIDRAERRYHGVKRD